jgi:hypothetical protein
MKGQMQQRSFFFLRECLSLLALCQRGHCGIRFYNCHYAINFTLVRAVFFAFRGVKEITKHMYLLTHYNLQSFLQSLFITTRKIIGTSI